MAKAMTKKKKSGPPPDRLKIEGDWKEAMKTATLKQKPATGWPKPK